MLWQGKTYKNPFEVSSEDVLELLSLWKNKEIEPEEVMAFGEDFFILCGNTWPDVPDNTEAYVTFVIIQLLEMLYINPVLPEDIPVLKKALLVARAEPEKALKELDFYFDSVDRESRLDYYW